jgi:hypothetical protein
VVLISVGPSLSLHKFHTFITIMVHVCAVFWAAAHIGCSKVLLYLVLCACNLIVIVQTFTRVACGLMF